MNRAQLSPLPLVHTISVIEYNDLDFIVQISHVIPLIPKHVLVNIQTEGFECVVDGSQVVV